MTAFAVIDPQDLEAMIERAVIKAMGVKREPEWITVREYCQRTGLSKSTVYRYINLGVNRGGLETRNVCGITQIKVDV